jgi:hypothetical protein
MTFQTSALILSGLAILLLALVVSGLVRQVHALAGGAARRLEQVGLPAGAPAPGLERLVPGRAVPLVLLFLSVDCRTCGEVLDEAVRTAVGSGLAIHALYAGPAPPGTPGRPVAVHGEQAGLFERYDAIVTPFAVVVDQDGRVIQSAPLGSAAAVRTLLERAAGTTPLGGRP